MKAAVYKKYGSPDVLNITEVEKPDPNDNEVLIRVFASTVNRTDCAMLRARPFIMRFFTGLFNPKKTIPGTDFAGMVEAVGKNVVSFTPGDKVFGFDDTGVMSHAQYMVFPENKALATIPENTSYEQAAASLEGAHYAYNFINKVKIAKGSEVLVNGATGAIGSAMVQLLKYFEASITAVGNTKNLDLLKSIGADKVVDYTEQDFTQSAEKYDFVFDAVGKSSFKKCKPLLKPLGVYISSELGGRVQNLFLALVTPWFGGKKVKFPLPTDIKGSVLLMKKLMEENRFKAVIDRKYPLDEIADAFRYVETGEKTGNVVIIQ
ncbi:NAD(P)-dependent alcohol dehydrogenase [Marivirga sp. S37H4]|uniref:NAD(P)-dependent alcohol dehydrogenase n=1 Tax=Marivirga aurantiaca TaxID=2802615 RepID=A0A935C7X1_9BACT|nr:NAD(P)-dependent alcohol dehydrogenase [Marivirga aurantiaca]MBK6265149.1 NAD(P)-dependent alcohol dehydrogenase [Marivirga aurantiaca]